MNGDAKAQALRALLYRRLRNIIETRVDTTNIDAMTVAVEAAQELADDLDTQLTKLEAEEEA